MNDSPEARSPLAGPREALREARGVVVFTGAGVSAESGVPTFRDRDGIWARFTPEELATPEGFRRDPRKVREWYGLRREAVLRCRPNPGHLAIARLLLERDDALLVTQNVDGLHQRAIDELGGALAAVDSRILELHGNLTRERCFECGRREEVSVSVTDGSDGPPLPSCERCGGLLRPDVVWFGEMLDAATLERAISAAAGADVCLVAGTSAVVYPAAGVPLSTHEGGGTLIEVNPEPTPLSRLARWRIAGPSGEVLPMLLEGSA